MMSSLYHGFLAYPLSYSTVLVGWISSLHCITGMEVSVESWFKAATPPSNAFQHVRNDEYII
jgi:hypothetical protein